MKMYKNSTLFGPTAHLCPVSDYNVNSQTKRSAEVSGAPV
jgi:hypothetical protein